MKRVSVRRENVIIPTYEIAEYDKNPMFLEKRVYQGSSGRVYPHPVCEGVSDKKTDREYKAIYLENDYILVMILPELGGRIQRLLDKTNGYDAVYYNEVVKPALVGLAGPWISGGIEFNWPQHHRPSTFDPVDSTIVEHEDGSVTVWVGETEKMFHTKGAAGFTVYPDKAYLEITGRLYNPTDRPQTFLWWANPAVAVNDYTRSIFPPDVNAVMDHGKRDVSKFPIADGVYYKVDYAPGTDISRYKNIPVPTSYMAYHSDFDFIGNYDDAKEAGLLHIADHHVSPGKKQWTWGNGDFGRAWDRNLTDENGPYIELMTGMFTDNQPDFTFLKPYEEKNFKQYFMPYKKCGAVKNANTDYAVNVERTDSGLSLMVYSMGDYRNTGDSVSVKVNGEEKVNIKLELGTCEAFSTDICCDLESETSYEVNITREGDVLLTYAPKVSDEPIPSPADPIPAPELVPTNEELFLDGVHLEQYRHATYNPADYYLEGLKRDPKDIRINNAYGKLLYKNGEFEKSIPYFETAIKRSTFKNPNPYDCEPYFNLGLAFERTERFDKAYDAFFKATWDGNMQDKAFFKLACLECRKNNYDKALEFIELSLLRGLHNMKARTIKTYLLAVLKRETEAMSFALETVNIDPLDMGARFLLSALTGEMEEFLMLMRGDNANYIELALTFMEAGLFETAADILLLAPGNEPMVNYYLFKCTEDEMYLAKAERASSRYCFPNRIDDVDVLLTAKNAGGRMAAYYLGCLFYDKGRWQDSVALWEEVRDDIKLPTVHRNLSLAYYNKMHDAAKAKESLEMAFSMDRTDARVFFELDCLLKIMEVSSEERLAFMKENAALLNKRDDLYTEYISLLNSVGKFELAYELMMDHIFHPWEGGEGKITGEYRKALMGMAEKLDDEAACELLNKALTYPHNLGEGKLIGAMDNDIYYYLGERTQDKDLKEKYYKLAARGEMNLSSAMYYNDQPPEMMYFRALAMYRLGQIEEAKNCFEKMIEYGNEHMDDQCRIDFFAVSLPDFLIFEGDLNKRNKKHCNNMIDLGKKGLEIR